MWGRGILFSRDHIEKGRAKLGRVSRILVFKYEKEHSDSVEKRSASVVSIRCPQHPAASCPCGHKASDKQ